VYPRDPQELIAFDAAHLWRPEAPALGDLAPLIIDSADGCWLVDVHGNRYIDGASSRGAIVHGHRHPWIDLAVRDQLARVAHTSLFGSTHPPAILLAHRLANLAPWGLERVLFAPSGSAAVQMALKMAVQYQRATGATGRTLLAGLQGGEHGDVAGRVGDRTPDPFHAICRGPLSDAIVLPAPRQPGGDEERACTEAALELLERHAVTLAAVVFEPLVQVPSGARMHGPAYLRAVLHRARELGVLLVADESWVGCGRTGTLFAMEQVGVAPDLLCLGRGLAAGVLPLGATLTTAEVQAAFADSSPARARLIPDFAHVGHPLACAAALASLDVFDNEQSLERVRRGERHLARLFGEAGGGIGPARHRGMLVGVDLPDGEEVPGARATKVAQVARELGAVVLPARESVVLCPPLGIPDEQLTALVRILIRAIRRE